MLHFVRRHAQSSVVWFIVIIIIFVFAFFGIDAVVLGTEVNTVATVEGVDIEPITVQRAELNLVEAYRNAYKEQFTPQLREALNLRQQALEGLIDRSLLLGEARKMGISIGETELAEVITGNPAFQRDGRFDKETYLRSLRYSRRTPATYEEGLLADLAVERLQRIVTDGVQVSEAVVRDAVVGEIQRRTFEYVAVPVADFEAEIDVEDEAAVQATYEDRKSSYDTPQRVATAMLIFSPEAFASQVEIEEEAIVEFYEENRETRFTQPHEVQARHILIRVDAGAQEDTKAAARDRLVAIEAKIEQGEDFAALATEFSEDRGSAAQGGDLGSFGKGRMVTEFEEAAFSLQPGETSGIVETPFGYHLIRVEGVQESREKPLDEVRDEIVIALGAEESGKKAHEAAEAVRARLDEDQKSLEDLAPEYGLTVFSPEPFGRNEIVPELGPAYALTTALFGLRPGNHTDPVPVGPRWVVARVDETIEPRTPALEEVRERVVADLRRARAREMAEQGATELMARALEAGSLEVAAESAGRNVQTSSAIARNNPQIPGMGSNTRLIAAVFGLSEEQPIAGETFELLGDPVVVSLGEVEMPDDETVVEKTEEVRAALTRASQQGLLRRYVDELKARADIQINTTLLDQLPPV